MTNHLWYLDSGATSSMTWNKKNFINYVASVSTNETVTSASGHEMKIIGRGEVPLKISMRGVDSTIILKHVLHVPDCSMQLLSVKALGSQGFITSFDKDKATICDSTGNILLIAESAGEKFLYTITPVICSVERALGISTKNQKLTLLEAHNLFGHLNHKSLIRTLKGRHTHGIKIKGSWEKFDCDSCHRAKSTVQPHDTEAERTAKYVGHIVCADLIDCRATQTIDDIKFISVIVDQYSYFTSVMPLREKDATSVLVHIKSFQAMLLSEGHKGIRIFRSDRGLEYNNTYLGDYAIDQHIRLELGVSREPRDNGFAERRIRTLIESAHSLLLSSGMAKRYWSLALEYATYIQNRSGRRSSQYRTPFQLFTNRIPNVGHAIEFGTKCWVHTATSSTQKFTPKAKAGTVVGFSTQSMGYRVLIDGKVSISRNVTVSKNDDKAIEQTVDPIPQRVAKAKAAEAISQRAMAACADELPPSEIPIPKGQLGLHRTLKGPLASYWRTAREKEIRKQLDLNVFEVCTLPEGSNAIRGHFIHSAKLNSSGQVKSLKARLVADGCGQLLGVDYHDTYAATPSPEIERLLLMYAASKDFEVHQIDVDNAYLHAPLDVPVYMQIPSGVTISHDKGEVLILKRALYGLKQAGRQWALHLKARLESCGWKQHHREECLFRRGRTEFLLVYVDDILIICPDVETVSSIKDELGELFPIKDLGEIREYLGVEVTRNREEKTFRLRQPGSIDAVIQRATQKFRVQSVPRSPYVASIRKEEPATKEQHDWFRSVVGQLGHISRMTRPDIANATNLLGRKLSCPTQEDILLVHNVIGYLQGTREIYLELRGSEFQSIQIKTYADADWASDEVDRKSTTGFITFLGPAPIQWASRKQKAISKSTMDAEYMAISDAATETVYLKNQAESILELSIPAKIYCDNIAAENLAKGDTSPNTKRSKHIDIRYHVIRDYVADGKIEVDRVPTELNTADIFTKPLARPLFERHRDSLLVH
jgi:hypothetical protein